MDAFEKLAWVSSQTLFEPAEEVALGGRSCGYTPAGLRRRYGGSPPAGLQDARGRTIPLFMAVGPGGRRFPLVKALLTTACERDCYYCAFRAGRDEHRVTFRPDEFARTFDAVHRAGAADGLFLSTGVVAGGANTQNRLLDTAEILRTRLGYRGYLHLKIMPGAEWGQVFRAMQLADRVSINLEAPGPARLLRLAPHKRFTEELLAPLRWAETIRRDHPAHLGWRGRWPSSTTQFVVGAAGEADVEILTTVGRLNRTTGLARAYFEAFHPVAGTPLENLRAEDPLRQHRLYQASFLLRDYGFDVEELPFGADGRLPLDTDPKDAFARNAFSQQPVDIHRADRETLLRVPGIGPRGATAILNARRQRRLRGLDDLRRLGVLADRAAPYITLDGRPRPRPRQLTLHGTE